MADYASAIRRATLEAGRLHRDFAIEAKVVHGTGRVDIYDAIARLGVPLFFTKLDGLLGVYLREPSPGVLVTTQRPQNQQRFTAAHELGHHYLGHKPSLDDESILRRAPFQAKTGDDLQEVEAEAFAAAFLLPRWLLDLHCERQSWTDEDLHDPINVYQLALRAGTSFEATVWTLHRYDVFDRATAKAMAAPQRLKKIKQDILCGFEPDNYRGDVWLITDHDAALHLEGGPGDIVVVRLPEHSGSGYLWRVESIDCNALAVLADGREEVDAGVGGPTLRRITTAARDRRAGEMRLAEARPWAPAKPLNTFALRYDLAGPSLQGFGPARDQGKRPTCLAFAASDTHAALRDPWVPLSCEFAFHHAQRRASRPPSTGASLTYMLAALKGDGQPVEADWPSLDALPAKLDDYGPPANVTVFRRAGEPCPHGVDEIIAQLNLGEPPLILMMLSDAFYLPDSHGVVVAPPGELPDPLRRHAVIGVGHGLYGAARAILVRNSWSEDWGQAGYAWLTETYLAPRLTRVALLKENVDVSATNLAA
jgi:Zn-dependent peptidase ImmA (M78 family)